MKKIYGGIYTQGPSKQTDQFIMDPTITQVESKLVYYYLLETVVHNFMLLKQKIVPEPVAKKILKELLNLMQKEDLESLLDPSSGDVHENIEKKLTEILGADAGWFHIARSRNDQSYTDQKLLTKKYSLDIFQKMIEFCQVLSQKTALHKDVVMPGFTHMRVAMPSSLGFWFQSYLEQTQESLKVFRSVIEMYDKSPLGAGASYGVNWKIEPQDTAKNLGFSQAFSNALAAIDSRGSNEAHIIAVISIFFTNISRMMEDLIIWSLPELNFISMSEEFTTGSSIMPQKMNPDIAEKVRSKTARFIGNLNYVLVAAKGTASGYNRDSAESKIAVIDTLEEALRTISITTDLVSKITPNQEAMKKAVIPSLATKLADLIVKDYGIPFRTAHHIVGKAVSLAGEKGQITAGILQKAAGEVGVEDISFAESFVQDALDPDKALSYYQYPGSPNPELVMQVNLELDKVTEEYKNWVEEMTSKFSAAHEKVIEEVEAFVNS